MREQALEVSGVSFGYTRKVKALENVTFSVPSGGFTALLGPNGAGKTTLMALITSLFAAEQGRIRVCGHALEAEPRKALAAMGVVFQRPTLDVDLSIEQNLRYAAALYGIPRAVARERMAELLARFNLADRAASKVRTLSGGMRRRVEIARALLHRPRLLVLDEPTVGLDIDSRRELVDHVHRLCREEGLAVLWATHLIDEIWPGDRVVLLHQGRVRAAGSIDEVVRAAGGGSLGQAYQQLTTARAA
ncbi:ABC transporter ATP-binding protein [Benzoatithermus flavus]|uniref:ABC transporter ATP-binding protein n=1 Tax=Benzoatithermus flavus TaxID=3108223 RepID=A0ABU8XVP6_9PROT